MPEMNPVKSSNIRAVGYDPATRDLHVHFNNGGRYVYADVPPEKHEALLSADSIGRHLHQHIRSAHVARKPEPEED